MAELATALAARIHMDMGLMLMGMVVVIDQAASTTVEEVKEVMAEATAMVAPSAMVLDLGLALVGPCMGPVDMVLVLVMVAMVVVTVVVMVEVGDMVDIIHMEDRDYNF